MIFTKKNLIESILETRVINPYKDFEPLLDTDKIRVYHGISSHSTGYVYDILTRGLSGQVPAGRIYSYEHGNNPKGVFVTINFETAKRNFSGSGVILEFDTIVKNLEAPVWKGQDSYFVQGQYTQSFKDEEERQEEILRKREMYRNIDPEQGYTKERIKKSDRPELAQTLFFNAERQALFVGNLNPNEIKNVWFNEGLFFDRRHGKPWVKYSRKDLLRKFGDEFKKNKREDTHPQRSYSNKLFNPNDDLTYDKFINALIRKDYLQNKNDIERIKYIVDTMKKYHLHDWFWPKQIKQFLKLDFPE